MKFKIVFYLFLFVCIVLFYQIFNTNKILNHQDELIQNQYQKQLQLKDSLFKLKRFQDTFSYFSLKGNPNLNQIVLEPVLQESELRKKLLEMNAKGGLNELIDMPSGRFLIDRVKVINDQWILIGFQSDKNWGQALLEYKIRSVGDDYDFKNVKSFIKSL
ncbi:hypothetical protein N9I15_00670 [Flavobacteriaceae bacterium]|jgi:hypothetical protein|nr:hypothetical protein [Flavobacteriaceae bacterium]MDA8877141.1 hypothetical protein [Flavobacteriaceae bacterium]MDA9037769.1 hypothetical protein [Flavobacteriaceae bacterium]MDA9587642.1 hypothetical protein [Flavobacteriaceae bacterium]MDC0872746.1 hypothetical protein [Flavobacteriaceae bacterium]